jgi:hypothetical protein
MNRFQSLKQLTQVNGINGFEKCIQGGEKNTCAGAWTTTSGNKVAEGNVYEPT